MRESLYYGIPQPGAHDLSEKMKKVRNRERKRIKCRDRAQRNK
jgi:hypothetical protein